MTTSSVPRPLPGMLRALLLLLLGVAAGMLVSGLVTGYPPVAWAALPFAVFGVAAVRSIQARFEAKYLALSDASAVHDNLRAARPMLLRAAGWAVLAVASLGAAAAILQSGG